MTKRVLITGCSSGFGLDAARTLARAGHDVVATMRDPEGRNATSAAKLRELAGAEDLAVTVVDMDVTSDESVASAMASVGAVDVAINNAGGGYGGPLESFTTAELLAQLDLNVAGPARVTQAVLPAMKARGEGLIIMVSSTAGRGAFPGFAAYHASKWGLEGMSEALRYELGPLGIDVALVEPGPFDTSFFANVRQGSRQEVLGDYPHVGEFLEGFTRTVTGLFANGEAPTDAHIVAEIFAELISMPAGQRPLRTIAGLDFGFKAINDATDPIRRGALESMGISGWDGARSGEASAG